jgi:hypothetical protein
MKHIHHHLVKKGIGGLREELIRAHIIISLLSICSIVLLILGSNLVVNFDKTLSFVAGMLLSALLVISMSIVRFLLQKRK